MVQFCIIKYMQNGLYDFPKNTHQPNPKEIR
jgi:hypothetical protein